MTSEELAARAGLKTGTFFVRSHGDVFRVVRFTRLRIYVNRCNVSPLPGWPADGGFACSVVGNHESYIEIPEYAVSGDGSEAERWVERVRNNTIILPETDEASVAQRIDTAAKGAAPWSADIELEVARHQEKMRGLTTNRREAVRKALLA